MLDASGVPSSDQSAIAAEASAFIKANGNLRRALAAVGYCGACAESLMHAGSSAVLGALRENRALDAQPDSWDDDEEEDVEAGRIAVMQAGTPRLRVSCYAACHAPYYQVGPLQ